MQKTAGQKKYAKAGDLSFDDLDGIKWTILIEAVILVLSGKLDNMEDESEDEDDKLLPDSGSKSAKTKAD